jgi:hypothetical protein
VTTWARPSSGSSRPPASASDSSGPPLDDALRLWDGLMMMAGVDGFWELKRTRTEDPDFTVPA